MRFVASPLMVAVALGLLGPNVLDVEEDTQEDCAAPPDSLDGDADLTDTAASEE